MKMLTVSALLCALMALTGAAALPEAEAQNNLTVKSRIVKRSTCAGHWSEFNGRCFQYIPRAMTWAKAEKNCQSMGGNLASVQNVQEYHEIQRLIMTISFEYKEAWIGGSDAQEEGVWLWSDGSHFSYMNWCPGQPDNGQNQQHCTQINFGVLVALATAVIPVWTKSAVWYYRFWIPGGSKHSFSSYFDGKCWDDLSCIATRPFVCAKTMR